MGELWLDEGRPVWHESPRPGRGPEGAHPLAERLAAYLAGAPETFADVELGAGDDPSPFHRSLERALRAVPRGEVVTYGELAALAGRPGAARAAGTFCARNRLSILVPCHRVVGASGPGSYGELGLGYKLRLLALEGVRVAL